MKKFLTKRNEIIIIRNYVFKAIDEFMALNRFIEVSPPILTTCVSEIACVGGSKQIIVNYFGNSIYLSQSGQLYLEMFIPPFESVYCISPTFREEKTTLLCDHLTEFWMCEVESSNYTFEEIIKLSINLIKVIIRKLIDNCTVHLNNLKVDIKKLEKIYENEIPVITYSEAITILKNNHISIKWGESMSDENEYFITRYFKDFPVVIKNYPKEISSFYKPENPANVNEALCFDIISPNNKKEIIGGSSRELNTEKIKEIILKEKEDINKYKWYINHIEKYKIPHAGFGLGIERLLYWICNLDDISLTIPFPRTETDYTP